MNPDHTEFVSVPQFAQLMGVSRALVYRLIRSGELPAIRVGSRGGIRILRLELKRFLACRRVAPAGVASELHRRLDQ